MMDKLRVDEEGAPIIEGLNAKIGTLERRRDYLRRKLRQRDYASTPSADFDRHEIDAIDAAVRAMRYHGATLRPEVDPILHLERLCDAFTGRADAFEVANRVREAQAALKELA